MADPVDPRPTPSSAETTRAGDDPRGTVPLTALLTDQQLLAVADRLHRQRTGEPLPPVPWEELLGATAEPARPRSVNRLWVWDCERVVGITGDTGGVLPFVDKVTLSDDLGSIDGWIQWHRPNDAGWSAAVLKFPKQKSRVVVADNPRHLPRFDGLAVTVDVMATSPDDPRPEVAGTAAGILRMTAAEGLSLDLRLRLTHDLIDCRTRVSYSRHYTGPEAASGPGPDGNHRPGGVPRSGRSVAPPGRVVLVG